MVSQSGSTTTSGNTVTYSSSNAFLWRDRALQSTITRTQGGATTTSTFTYNANNFLTYVNVTGTGARQISYTTDAAGQIMVRTQATGPKEFSFFFNGVKIGGIGNNGTDNVDYATAIIRDGMADGGNFGKAGAVSYSDFDQNWSATLRYFDKLSTQGSRNPAAGVEGANGSYTVIAGQTLSSIASALWGDASLWYLLAQANGLTSDNSVTGGQVLVVPAQVTNFHNSASTYKPYDAAQAIGDVAPGAPKPPKKNYKCGVFGAILRAVISAAVRYVLGPVAVIPVIGPMVVSTVSQAISTAVGLQRHIDWKQVAMAGVQSGVSYVVGKIDIDVFDKVPGGAKTFSAAAKGFVNDTVRGAVIDGISQGIGVATGLQDKFSWAGVAASGIASGAAGLVDRFVPGGVGESTGQKGPDGKPILRERDTFGHGMARGMAYSMAYAATRSLIEGSNFGDNITASLPGMIGQVVGDQIAWAVVGRDEPVPGERPDDIVVNPDAIGAADDPQINALIAANYNRQHQQDGNEPGLDDHNSVNPDALAAAGNNLPSQVDDLTRNFPRVVDLGPDGLAIATGSKATVHRPVPAEMQAQYEGYMRSTGRTASAADVQAFVQTLNDQYLSTADLKYASASLESWADFLKSYQQGGTVSLAMTYPVEVDVSQLNQLRGQFLTSKAGAFAWGELSAGSFGIATAFDTTGAVQAAADKYPGWQTAGMLASIAVGGLGSAGGKAAVATESGYAARAAVLREVYANTGGRLLTTSELRGLKFTIREVEKQGYRLTGSIKYGGNNGIDLVFEGIDNGVVNNLGRSALAEAKASASLGSLSLDKQFIRQGSEAFFLTRLERAGQTGLRDSLINGNVDLFGGFAGKYVNGTLPSGRLFKFDPAIFTKNENLRTTVGAAIQVK